MRMGFLRVFNFYCIAWFFCGCSYVRVWGVFHGSVVWGWFGLVGDGSVVWANWFL